MSHKTKSQVTKILRAWINGVQAYRKSKNRKWLPKMPYFTFVTLTLSSTQRHNDKEIRRKMIIPFIQKLRRKFNVWHYLFVCEKQTNGNIHVHILIDSYIKHAALRTEWNATQDLHGYIQPFFDKWGHRNPNSTDIHKLENINDVQAYVIKYMTTDKKDLKLEGRLWGCSDALRKLKTFNTEICGEADTILSKIIKSPLFEQKHEENYTLITGPVYQFIKTYHRNFFNKIQHWQSQQIETLYKCHPELTEQEDKPNKESIPIDNSWLTSFRPNQKVNAQIECPF